MLPAARHGDLTSHGGTLQGSSTTVLVEGVPPILIGDIHICPMPGHIPLSAQTTSSTVWVEGRQWLRIQDIIPCNGPCVVSTAASSVTIGSRLDHSSHIQESNIHEYPFSR